jgi:hypothetical protein
MAMIYKKKTFFILSSVLSEIRSLLLLLNRSELFKYIIKCWINKWSALPIYNSLGTLWIILASYFPIFNHIYMSSCIAKSTLLEINYTASAFYWINILTFLVVFIEILFHCFSLYDVFVFVRIEVIWIYFYWMATFYQSIAQTNSTKIRLLCNIASYCFNRLTPCLIHIIPEITAWW